MDVAAWLRELGLERYVEAFAAEDIDAEVLPALADADLEKLGVSLGHRKKLLKAIENVGAQAGDAPLSADGAKPAADRATGAERRQLTVMFVDLVGSTELAARLDPEDLSAVMRAYQNRCSEIVERWDGHVAKYLGDGVLAYFGWPRAHEDDVERAVRAGLDLVAAVAGQITPDGRSLAARIGVATGLVVVGDLVGEGAAQEEAVVGETPNLAARLQELAASGQVVIAEGTRRLLGDVFELTDLGAKSVKGLGEPVRAFAVTGEREMTSRFEARSGPSLLPMVGRDQELALLIERWAQARAGEGQGVLLVGEAGIGKSRIVRALLDVAADEPHTRVRYQCSPYHRDSAFWPVIQQLTHAAGLATDDPTDARLDKLEALLGQADGGTRGDTAPLIAELLGLDGEARYGELNLTPQAQRARTLEALVGQLLGLAAGPPVLVVLEDAHWIDPTTLEMIEQGLDRIAVARVLILLTSRPDQQPALAGRPHVTRLTLNRLGRAGVEAIITRLGGDRLPGATIDTIIARTDGVPLFVEELTKAVLETGEATIPASLHDSLMARLDRFPGAKEVAQTAACIGREFSHRLLVSVAERAEPDLVTALDKLAAAELIFRRGSPPEATYSFKHALVQDAAYGSLLRSRRKRLHGRIAAVLEERFPEVVASAPELTAYHYTEAGLAEPAVRGWLAAGEHAARRSAYLEAIAHVRRGLTLLESIPNPTERIRRELELQTAHGAFLIPLKGQAAAEVGETYARAEELCRQTGDTSRLYSILQGLWHFHAVRAELERARELAERCDAIAQSGGDPAHLLAAHLVLCGSLCWAGDFGAARDHLERAQRVEDRAPRRSQVYSIRADVRVFMRGFGSYAVWHLGHSGRALRLSDEAVALAYEAGDPFSLAMALDHASMLHQFGRDHRAVAALATAAVEACSEHRFAYYLARATFLGGWASAADGRVDDGITRMRRGLADLDATGCRLRRPYFLALLAEAHIDAGQPEEGLKIVTDAIALAETTGERWRDADLHTTRGRLLLALSRAKSAEADACFQSALEIARKQNAKSLELRAATNLAHLWAEQGARQKALDLLAPVYDWFTEGFDTQDLIEARALLGELR